VREQVVLVLALIDELDAHARVQEGQLPQPLGENVVVEADVGEDLCAWPEADRGAPIVRVTHRR